ncbi:MAG: hypothetical protein K1X75_08435 [Leptospirales bacterium]|nr:hypothetical protein [Leptospirales bacterium]
MILLLLASLTVLVAQRSAPAPTESGRLDPFLVQPPFGQGYGQCIRALEGRSVVSIVAGREIQFQSGALEFTYRFDLAERLEAIETDTREQQGRQQVVFRSVRLSPAIDPDDSPLYAVHWQTTPHSMDFDGHDGLLARLRELYPQLERSDSRLLLQGGGVQMLIPLQKRGEQWYWQSAQIVSLELTRRRAQRIQALQLEIDRAIQRTIEEKSRELRSSEGQSLH